MTHTHFRIETDGDNIVWLHFDKADGATNVLNAEVFAQLDQHLQNIAAQCPRGLVILSDKANGFIAGADISEFNAPPKDPWLPELVQKIEDCPKLVVAAIHGTALGVAGPAVEAGL